MNILIINYEYPPIGGGAAKATYNIVKRIALKNDIKIYLLFGANKEFSNYPFVENVEYYPVFYPRKSIHETGALGMIIFLFKAAIELKKIIKNNKIDLIHYFFSVPTGLLSFLHMKSIPYIVSLRGGDVPKYNPGEMQLFHFLLKPLNKLLLKKSKRVVALSNNLGEMAKKELGIKNYSVVYNGIDIKRKKNNYKKPNGKLKIITISRLIDWKRIDLIIKAIKDFRDVKLRIIGTGKEENRLKQLVKKLNINDSVEFLGFIKNKDIHKYLINSDIFILPSIGDSFGIVFLEAMACGLPIIAAKAGGVPEVVHDGYNGFLVEPNNLEELVNVILNLKEDKQLRKTFSVNSLKLVKEKFGWDKGSQQYYELYDNINKK